MSKTCLVWLVNRVGKICRPTGEERMIMTKASVKNVTQHLKLPVIIFHEDLTDQLKKEFLEIYSDITFGQLDSFIDNDLPYDKETCKCSKGYMMMCRFFSGIMQSHKLLEKYDAYIRFDDDSFLIKPYINLDKFLLEANNYSYIYRSVFNDNQESINKQNGLFNFTYSFCIENNLPIEKLLPSLKQNKFICENIYTGLSPYNNFHYSKLSLWKHPIIKKYIDSIMNINGCLLYNWMDANIHGIIIFLLCPLLNINIKAITDFGYRHNWTFSNLNNVNFYGCGEIIPFYPKE